MTEASPTYSTETVLIPTFMVLIGCPKCKSRNIRTFPNIHFMDDDFPEKATNFINIQGQCKDCGTFLLIGLRQYMIDSTVCEPSDEVSAAGTRVLQYGLLNFSGTLVDVGGEPAPDVDEIRCEWCSASFHSDFGLKIHQRTCHMKPDDVKKAEQDEEDKLEREEELREQAARGDISLAKFNAEMDKITEPKKKLKKKRKKAKKKTPTLRPAPSAKPSDLDREMAESLGEAKPKKVKKKTKPKRRKKAKPKPEKKRSDHPVCSLCDNRDGEECLVGLAPSVDELASRCEGFGYVDEWHKCRYCEEEFASDDARIRHQKTCDKKPDEPQERKALFLPSSTEVTQDPADVDKSILYTSGSDTLVSLVQEVQMSAYRKDITTCPRTDYVDDGKGGVKSVTCGYEAKADDWLSSPMLKEISFGISDLDIGAPMTTTQEEMVVCISECPKCGRKSIKHQFITTMLWEDFTDHRLIMQHIVSRGLMEGKVKKKEMTEEQIDTRLDYEAQRLGMPEGAMKKIRKSQRETRDKSIPDFEIPCWNNKCKAILTQDNSNPRWMSPEHLVARCPICGYQSPIQDELREMGIDV